MKPSISSSSSLMSVLAKMCEAKLAVWSTCDVSMSCQVFEATLGDWHKLLRSLNISPLSRAGIGQVNKPNINAENEHDWLYMLSLFTLSPYWKSNKNTRIFSLCLTICVTSLHTEISPCSSLCAMPLLWYWWWLLIAPLIEPPPAMTDDCE